MSTSFKKGRITKPKLKNRLLITWKDYSPKPFGTERESLRCNSLDKANIILSKRDKRRIYFAKFFDNNGVVSEISLNTKDTILSI